MAKSNVLNSLPDWTTLSVLIIVGADWLIGTTSALSLTISAILVAALPAGILVALGFNVFVSIIVGIAVFFVELGSGRKPIKALTYGGLALVVVVIPTPIPGTLVGGIKVLKYVKK